MFSSKLPSVVRVSTQINIRDHAEAVFADDPDMKKLLVTTLGGLLCRVALAVIVAHFGAYLVKVRSLLVVGRLEA